MQIDRKSNNLRVKYTAAVSLCLVVLAVVLLFYFSVGLNSLERLNEEKVAQLTLANQKLAQFYDENPQEQAHFVELANISTEAATRSATERFLVLAVPFSVGVIGLTFGLVFLLLRSLEKSYQARYQFVQDTTHELRNPLAAAIATLQNVRGDLALEDNAEEAKELKRVESQLRGVAQLAQDLLYLEAPKKKASRVQEKVNLAELVADVIEEQHQLALQSGVELQFIQDEESDSQPLLKADPQDLVILARNLIANAIAANSIKVELSVSVQKQKIIFTVSDDGQGMTEAEIAGVTKRFVSFDRETERAGGTGLGLAIVSKIVNQYRGKLHITSQTGKGTTVKITF